MNTAIFKTFFLIIVISISGCSSAKDAVEQSFSQWDEDKPHLIFANFKIEKKAGKIVGGLIDKTVVEGSLKKGMTDDGDKSIRFSFLDLDQQSIGIGGYSDNPLSSIYEYADDDGLLKKKRVETESGTLSTRMLLPSGARYISVELKEEAGSYKEIIRTSI